jgi:hypothetical protein
MLCEPGDHIVAMEPGCEHLIASTSSAILCPAIGKLKRRLFVRVISEFPSRFLALLGAENTSACAVANDDRRKHPNSSRVTLLRFHNLKHAQE